VNVDVGMGRMRRFFCDDSGDGKFIKQKYLFKKILTNVFDFKNAKIN
jgi:hypothetical protein